jgi:hypothetical protein
MRGTGARSRPTVASRSRVADAQAGFGGGLNTTAADTELAPNQVRFCTNGILSQFGDVTKRLGTRRLSSAVIAAAAVRNGICWRTATDHEYLVACNGRLYSGGNYSTAMTWTDKGALASESVYPSFAAFRDASAEGVYIADGAALRKYTAGTLSAPAGAQAVATIAVYNQRLFGITGTNQTIYYSALNDGDTLGNAGSGGGSAVVRTFSAQKLTGLLTLKNSLAMFHVSGVSRFTGYTQDDIGIDAGTEGISTDVGTIAPRGIIAVDGLGFFLSERGAYMINDAGVQRLDTPNSPDPTVPLMAALPEDDFEKVDATYDKLTKTIRWNIPGSGIYLYHLPLNAWSGPWTGDYVDAETHCLFDGVDDNGAPITVVGFGDGYLLRADYPGTYKDSIVSAGTGGNSYTLNIQCRRFYTSHPEAEKAWRWAYVFADLRGSITAAVTWRTSTGTGTYTMPNVSSGTQWGSGTWGSFFWGGQGAKPFRIPMSGRGTFVDISISDDGDANSVYSRVTLEAFDYGRRG